jgi:hypothetical protein
MLPWNTPSDSFLEKTSRLNALTSDAVRQLAKLVEDGHRLLGRWNDLPETRRLAETDATEWHLRVQACFNAHGVPFLYAAMHTHALNGTYNPGWTGWYLSWPSATTCLQLDLFSLAKTMPSIGHPPKQEP